MESWRKEFYGSDYGSEYLMHYRTKGSRNGISRTEGYRAVGSLAKGISTVSSNRPNSRKTTVSGQATGGLGRKGSVPLGETAGNFKPTGPNGLNESYAANRPTTPPSGKIAEEPKPNGLTTEQAEALENKPAPKPMKKKDDRVIFDRLASQQPSVYDREKVQQQATENAINKIKNEPIASVLTDYAGIVGDITKLMAKGTLAGYASMLPGHNDAARIIGESVQNDARKLGYRIGTRIVKNRIRKGR